MNGYIPQKTLEKLNSTFVPGERHKAMLEIAISLIGNQMAPNEVFGLIRQKFPDEDKSDKEISDLVNYAISIGPAPSVPSGAVKKNYVPFVPAAPKPRPAKEVAKEFIGDTKTQTNFTPLDPVEFLSLYDMDSYLNVVIDFEDVAGKAKPHGSGITKQVHDWIKDFNENKIPMSKAGAWIRFNPCTEVGSGAVGAYTDKDILDFRFVLLESDTLPVETQLALYRKFRLPIAAIISSGGSSYHAWIKVHATNHEEYRELSTNLLRILKPMGFDENNKNESRLTRLPGAVREIGKGQDPVQHLIFVNREVVPLTVEGLCVFEESLKPMPLVHKTIKQLAADATGRYDDLIKNEGVRGVKTGIRQYDLATGGLKNGTFSVLGAKTNVGKSAFALNLIHSVLKVGKTVVLFSMEMDGDEIVDLILTMQKRIDRNKFNTGKFNELDIVKMQEGLPEIAKYKLFIYDQPDPQIKDIKTCCKRLHQELGVDLIVVDYLQLAETDLKRDSREQQVATIGKSLRSMAKELKVPVFALSQLNDEGKLRESRTLGHEAHVVFELEEPDNQPDKRFVRVTKGRGIPKMKLEMDFEAVYSIMREHEKMRREQ